MSAVLAAALRRVSILYRRCRPQRPDVNDKSWLALEAEVDDAFAAGDRDRTLDAVRAWKGHAERVLADSQPAEAACQPLGQHAGGRDG